MTEEVWLHSTAPGPMIEFITPRSNQRKQRLLLGACCRRIGRLLQCASIWDFITASERYADGGITLAELKRIYWAVKGTDPIGASRARRAHVEAEGAVRGLSHNLDLGHMIVAVNATVIEVGGETDLVFNAFLPIEERQRLSAEHAAQYELAATPENLAQTELVRDVFGNPFRPVAISALWRTSTAVAVAAQIYESRDFGAMPILADALQDAGCDSADVLDHCRGPGPHVRGCWVVDLVLGKT